MISYENLNNSLSYNQTLLDEAYLSFGDEEQQSIENMYQQNPHTQRPSIEHKTITKYKKLKKAHVGSPQKVNKGHWSEDEHDTYLCFLSEHQCITLQNAQNRKNNKIFKLMSITIGSRSPSQCRSHHQKFNPLSPKCQKSCGESKRTKTKSQAISSDTNFARRLDFSDIGSREPVFLNGESQCYGKDFEHLQSQEFQSSQSLILLAPKQVDQTYINSSRSIYLFPDIGSLAVDDYIDNLFGPINTYTLDHQEDV